MRNQESGWVQMWERVMDHRLAKKYRREKAQKSQSPYTHVLEISSLKSSLSNSYYTVSWVAGDLGETKTLSRSVEFSLQYFRESLQVFKYL